VIFRASAATLLLALAPPNAQAAAGVPVDRLELVAESVEGCPGIPFPRARREFVVDGDAAVDAAARFWELDRPSAYAHGHASRRYRIGPGTLEVEAELSPEFDRERAHLVAARSRRPSGDPPSGRATSVRADTRYTAGGAPGGGPEARALRHRAAGGDGVLRRAFTRARPLREA
jgi:hypothetical protein